MPYLKEQFTVSCSVDPAIEVGLDLSGEGRRRLIVIPGGTVKGIDNNNGKLLPGGIDSQIIRPNGKADISARYAIAFDDGTSIYIQNDGIRTVPPEDVQTVVSGGFVDPSHYYFVTAPKIEVYDKSREWMANRMWICVGIRKPETVDITYYTVEL